FGFAVWNCVTRSASACCASGLAPGSRPTTLSVTLVFGSSVVEEPESPDLLLLEPHATSVLLSASAPTMANANVVREYFIVAPCRVCRHPARHGGDRWGRSHVDGRSVVGRMCRLEGFVGAKG